MTRAVYLTADIPGTGGVIKQRPEDFLVEEQPLYPPAATGEHLYLFVEKRLRSTTDVVHKLARVFHVRRGDVGYAGLKDKHAVTRQLFSIWLPRPGDEQAVVPKVEDDHIKVLWSARHLNKLRRGHLTGNRFAIRIRGVDPGVVTDAKRVLDRLAVTGVPNFFGEQRFGYRHVNHRLGRLLLLGRWQEMLDLMLGHPLEYDHAPTRAAREAYERRDYTAALELLPRHLHTDRQALDVLRQGKTAQEAVMAIDVQHRGFLLSALQSMVFNRVLQRRLYGPAAPGIGCLVEGDLAWLHAKQAVFAVDRPTADKENAPGGRVPSLEVSPSGPMWASGMTRAGGVVWQWERDALEEEGVTESAWENIAQSMPEGARRSMRTTLRDPRVSSGADEHGPYVQVSFELPRGSFATVVLQEIIKPQESTTLFDHDHPTAD